MPGRARESLPSSVAFTGTASMELVGGAPATELAGTHAGLVLLYAPHFERWSPAYPLEKQRGDLLIGRDDNAGICIPGAAVSRRHARIRARGDGWVLTDLGGKNGTIVDGRFVSEIELEPLHEIRIGDAVFKFVDSGAEHYARYRIDGTVVGESAPPRKRVRGELIGGYQIDRIAKAVERVARSAMSVVLLGETGTGKELFAELVHEASGRKGRLVAVNCAALPPALVESELFGHRRGAFTGADRDKIGLVRSADGGTLFLDEVGDLPLETQAKLLRLLQSKDFIPLGASAPERADVRFVAATHRDLARRRSEGTFRDDLFARLHEYAVVLPPLRERKEDIYALARAFLARAGARLDMSFAFVASLIHHDFPLNVRELASVMKRAAALCEGAELLPEHLPEELQESMRDYARRDEVGRKAAPKAPPAAPSAAATDAPPDAPDELSDSPSEDDLRALFRLHHGNLSAVARELGKGRMQIHRWTRRYGIVIGDYR